MAKKLYKVTLLDEEKQHITLYASEVARADFLGFIEISGFEFPKQSNLILTPGEDRAHSLFKETERLIIPGNMVLRIEELKEDKKTQIIKIFNTDNN